MNRNYKKVVIVDYKMSNLFSVQNALKSIGFETEISSNKNIIKKADFIVLPGVGSFPKAMKEIRKLELDLIIKEYINSNKPLLGICLGFQLLFDYSEEFIYTEGLGIIKGHVKNLTSFGNIDSVPHVGWNKIKSSHKKNNMLGEFDNKYFYFVHSYAALPEKKEDIFFTTKIGNFKFCSSIKINNIIATQFHPEKSGILGLKMMRKIIDGGGSIE